MIQISRQDVAQHTTDSTPFPGKLRGIQQLANEREVITVTALDHRGSLKQSLQRAMPNQVIGYNEVVAEKLRMVRVFAPHSSAILLDPVFGAAQAVTSAALPGNVGLIVALEESGYEGGDEARVTPITVGWSVGKIKRLGAAAVKLLLFYHPDAPSARGSRPSSRNRNRISSWSRLGA